MNILAFEASGSHASVALLPHAAAKPLLRRGDTGASGSLKLLPWAAELLAEAGLALGDLGGIAFGAGPGAFTGLRLACGVTQGLACGLGLPVAPVCTLEALALAACPRGEGSIVACLDARMHEVYYGFYRVEGQIVRELRQPECVPPVQVETPAGQGWIGCGDGFAAYPELARLGLDHIGPDIGPAAGEVAILAKSIFARGDGIDPALAMPLYVRDKVALTTVERLARGGSK